MFGESNVTWNPVTNPNVTMKARFIIRSACNDKVFDASENVFDKTVSSEVWFVQRCICTSKKETLLCQRFG